MKQDTPYASVASPISPESWGALSEVVLGPPGRSDPVPGIDELVTRAARGDRRAIGSIAIAFGPALLAEARTRTRNRADAEDVVQQLLLHLVEGRAAQFPPAPGRGLAWLAGLVKAMASARDYAKGGR